MSQIKLQPPRGTRDLIGEEFRRHHRVIKTARRISALYGFEEWATPIFEDTRVFARGLGETSDVVSKEMYEFQDRGGESVTLRPENTAGVCRALVSGGLTQSLPRKVFYAGPMFRYERPQAGRYRQFHQIGAEVLGAAEPLADAEVIACGYHIIRELGLDEGVILEVNTLGDAESRDAYRAALIAHFTAHRDKLSEDSQRRLEKNPLRIIDSKEAQDRALVAEAPTIEPFLTEKARAHWDALRRHLTTFAVPFRENPRIVRGLDYYSHTAFEFVTDRLGAQGTVMGGGRYDGLVEEMGGPPTPSVGWAAGVERLAMLMEKAGLTPAAPRLVTVIPVSDAEEGVALNLLQSLRAAGLGAEMGYRGNLKRRMERANKQGARAAIIIGETEAAAGVAQLRDLDAGTQEQVPFTALVERLKK
ncbi:histidine--tRNA ligase [Roseococcus sp. SDR]|uniref:histidine--tRNA ligase n=1 Tax=Roseococcus sp. SDR TaxID=2835532 RepID=UPI001BCC3AE0|nr:histidine--tRNA ligase [Roseococcus sp. SDR]MBS7790447.1 histidine--tRNA ligase [Roseococcus sp. SDR]MBV1845761.1 histidine--tRNA ligase [Roseococcus sp. SDR]